MMTSARRSEVCRARQALLGCTLQGKPVVTQSHCARQSGADEKGLACARSERAYALGRKAHATIFPCSTHHLSHLFIKLAAAVSFPQVSTRSGPRTLRPRNLRPLGGRMKIHENARLTPPGRERTDARRPSRAARVCPRAARKRLDRFHGEGLARLQERSWPVSGCGSQGYRGLACCRFRGHRD